jgi:hypothetical protein
MVEVGATFEVKIMRCKRESLRRVGTRDFYVEFRGTPALVTLISKQVPCAVIEFRTMVYLVSISEILQTRPGTRMVMVVRGPAELN